MLGQREASAGEGRGGRGMRGALAQEIGTQALRYKNLGRLLTASAGRRETGQRGEENGKTNIGSHVVNCSSSSLLQKWHEKGGVEYHHIRRASREGSGDQSS